MQYMLWPCPFVCMSVRPSICLSVTSWCSIKTPHGSPDN